MKSVDAWARSFAVFLLMLFALAFVSGCSRLRPHPAKQYVYVSSEHTFLRDRVAPVANFVTEVTNGQRLQVLEHETRFYRVKAPNGKEGWIEEYYIIDQPEMDRFNALRKEYAHTPAAATALLEEVSYLHDAPGRKTPHYYLLPVNDKLDLIQRASVVKPQSTLAILEERAQQGKDAGPPLPPPMEDYWLVRDSQGRTGWVRASALEADVPNSIAVLAGSDRMIGGYLLRTVDDPDSDAPNHEVGEYLTVLAPYQEGLPYDFDQVRVFTWNMRRHRYELAYRERDLEGFFPVQVGRQTVNGRVEPVFSFQVSLNPKLALNAKTGEVDPGSTQKVTFRMDGVIVRKVSGPDRISVKSADLGKKPARKMHFRRHHKKR